MSWHTSQSGILLRGVTRRLGINRVVARMTQPGAYEHRFQDVMLGLMLPGDVVWDVGANVGVYAMRFASLVGPAGKVFAFEPSPVNRLRLAETVAGATNVVVVPLALGNASKTVYLQQGSDALGATTQVMADAELTDAGAIVAHQESGDRLIADRAIDSPTVIKIDTEGHELEVLRGMAGILETPSLRAICLEVHFGLLAARGVPDTPAVIEQLLKTAGFRLTWPDASHLVATRLG